MNDLNPNPFAVYTVDEQNDGFKVDLLRASNSDPSMLAHLIGAAKSSTNETLLDRVGRTIKSYLDLRVRGDGFFLVAYGANAEFLAGIDEQYLRAIALAASKVGDRADRAPAFIVTERGTMIAELRTENGSLVLEFAPKHQLTVVSVRGLRFGCPEEPSWIAGQDWEPAQGLVTLEWQGKTPADLEIVLRQAAHIPRERVLESLTQVFWRKTSPALDDPFVLESGTQARYRVGLDGTKAASSHCRRLSFATGRGEAFLAIVGDLLRAHAPVGSVFRISAAFPGAAAGKFHDGVSPLPFEPHLDPANFGMPTDVLNAIQDLLAWARPAGHGLGVHRGFRESGGQIRPLTMEFQLAIAGITPEERLGAGQRARKAIGRIEAVRSAA